MKTIIQTALALCLALTVCGVEAQSTAPSTSAPLRDVKTIQVDPTIVPNPEKVKEPSAPNLVQDSLKNALRMANIEIAENAPIRAHILPEVNSSRTRK